MTVALAGSAPATFEIKSANLPLVSLLLKTADLQAMADELAQRFGDIPDFFDHDPLVIDLSPLSAADQAATIDFPALLGLLRARRMSPVAVRGGSAGQLAAALAAGLVNASDAVGLPAAGARVQTVVQEVVREVEVPVPVAGPATLVVDRPLRSGQKVYAKGRDLVVLAMVNPGAEVIADGHIHVYAPLRGKAMPGARGTAEARICSLCLPPVLVSSAGL